MMEKKSSRDAIGTIGRRLFTVLYGGKVLKVGRVQTPTLAMLVERESKIIA
jgi:DNA topoisomerase-3